MRITENAYINNIFFVESSVRKDFIDTVHKRMEAKNARELFKSFEEKSKSLTLVKVDDTGTGLLSYEREPLVGESINFTVMDDSNSEKRVYGRVIEKIKLNTVGELIIRLEVNNNIYTRRWNSVSKTLHGLGGDIVL